MAKTNSVSCTPGQTGELEMSQVREPLATGSNASGFGRLDRWLRRRVIERMQAITRGRLIIRDELGETVIGRDDGLTAEVRIHDSNFWRLMATGGSVGAAEAYMAGMWDSPDLVGVIQVLARNRDALDARSRAVPESPVCCLRSGIASIATVFRAVGRNTPPITIWATRSFPPGWITHDVLQRIVP